MEAKKTPKADLENKKNIFLEIGLMISLLAVFSAFEWKTAVPETSDFITVSTDPGDEIMVPITTFSLQQPPPPPPQLRPLTDWIDIVEDEDPFANELDISDITTTSNGTSNAPISIEDIGNIGTQSDELEPVVFVPSEDMPFFPDVQQWIAKHIKYPAIAAENGIYGKVYVRFIVEKNGSVSNVEIVKGVDPSLDKEAIRVIESMPKWTPGKQRGKAVRVSYNMPIKFQLTNY